MQNRLKFLTILLCIVCTLSSCKTKEEKAIENLSNLVAEVESNGQNYSMGEWKSAIDEFVSIHDDMRDCHFDDEQLRLVGEMDGRLTVIFTKKGAKDASKSIKETIEKGKVFIEGLKAGFNSEYSEKEFKEIGNEIKSIFDDIR